MAVVVGPEDAKAFASRLTHERELHRNTSMRSVHLQGVGKLPEHPPCDRRTQRSVVKEYTSLLDSDFYRCVRANDTGQIHVIEQLDLDRDQLGYLGIRTGSCKTGS